LSCKHFLLRPIFIALADMTKTQQLIFAKTHQIIEQLSKVGLLPKLVLPDKFATSAISSVGSEFRCEGCSKLERFYNKEK
jgi:hypothetical protein